MISTTGRRPSIAAPTAAPTKPSSAIGVSMTRSAPNSFRNPAVILYEPSNAPISSPIKITDRMALEAEALDVHERRDSLRAGALDGFADRVAHRQHVVAVDFDARDAIGARLLV